MDTLNNFLKEIEELKKAKELLDDILYYYSIYGNSFDNEQIQKDDKLEESRARKDRVPSLTLNDAIRAYKNFDDSE